MNYVEFNVSEGDKIAAWLVANVSGITTFASVQANDRIFIVYT